MKQYDLISNVGVANKNSFAKEIHHHSGLYFGLVLKSFDQTQSFSRVL